MTDDWLDALAGSSEMGQAISDHDWSSTSLGPLIGWPLSLRTAVGILLTSRFPMTLVWGPDLVQIYNDGFRPMLGTTKHPRALGSPAREVWPEVWHEIGPLFRGVLDTGVPTWAEHHRLVLERNGFPEECYFTFSYSPLHDGSAIGGVLDIAVETTEQVVSARRLGCVSVLAEHLLGAQQVTDVCVRALDAFSVAPIDIRAADIYLLVDGALVLVASNRRDDVAPLDPAELSHVVERQNAVAVGWVGGSSPADHFAVPIGGSFGGVSGVLAATLHAERPFDDAYRGFLHLVADAISTALDGAFQRTVELGEYRRISDTLQAAMLKPASDFATVAARYLPALGNLAVGGDWYDVIDLGDDQRGLVVGDCVGHGLEAATVMAQLRSATRAMLLEGNAPSKVLDSLDLFAASLDGAYCTTVVCAIFDRGRGIVTYSRAGHPPPMLVNRRGVTWLDQAGGPPLAVPGMTPRSDVTLEIDGDDTIVLYSDGLIERRGESLDIGLERLARAGREMYGSTVHEIADGLLRRLLPENTRDDVVLVVKQLATDRIPTAERIEVDADLVFDFLGARSAPRDARRAIAAMFGEPSDAADSIGLAVSELVSNVVLHTSGPGRLTAWNVDPVRIHIDDTDPNPPRTAPSAPDGPSGRGMFIVDQLATRWGVDQRIDGKTMWVEFERPG